ncbi:SDR family oxidoreductase [Actinoplanes sp. CA-131856]
MTRSLARELLPRRIRVNAVSPGPIDSGVPVKSMPRELADATKSQMAADNQMLRLGTPAEGAPNSRSTAAAPRSDRGLSVAARGVTGVW